MTAKRSKAAALAMLMAGAFCAGAWLLISPIFEKQRMLDRQAELLDSISNGSGVIALEESFPAGYVDFYDMGGVIFTAQAELPQEEPAPAALEVTGTGILIIGRIDAVLPVTDGVSETQLKVAVGHVPQTAPLGGEGNAVIAGHRSYTYGHFFNRLGEVSAGDLIQYEDKSGAAFTYEVFETLVIEPGDQAAFIQPEGERLLTLYTCTPIRKATHRLLVRARLVEQIPIETEESQ